jgi:hypothetical protein
MHCWLYNITVTPAYWAVRVTRASSGLTTQIAGRVRRIPDPVQDEDLEGVGVAAQSEAVQHGDKVRQRRLSHCTPAISPPTPHVGQVKIPQISRPNFHLQSESQTWFHRTNF